MCCNKEFTGARQDNASGMRGYMFRIVVCCNTKFTGVRQTRHCMSDERLQVLDNSVL